MNWVRFALTVLAGGVGSSLTDWLFMGDWLYKSGHQHPEIWRFPGGEGESIAIAWASPLPFLTCALFALVCEQLHVHSSGAVFRLAAEIWLMGPLPLIVTNSLFMKLQPKIVTALSPAGWRSFA